MLLPGLGVVAAATNRVKMEAYDIMKVDVREPLPLIGLALINLSLLLKKMFFGKFLHIGGLLIRLDIKLLRKT